MNINIVIRWCIVCFVVAQESVKVLAVDFTCKSPNHDFANLKKTKIYEKLLTFQGKRYSTETTDKTFYFGVCAVANLDVVQGVGSAYKQKEKPSILTTLGSFENTDIRAGSNWVMLKYNKDKKGLCSSSLMITCNPHITDNNVHMELLEGSSTDCNYLFELEHSGICSTQHLISFSLSMGSIFVIMFVCLTIVYIVGGVVYMRVVRGAKGRDQIPHFAFWKDFGNLQADGCNFLCRTSSATRDSRPYKGVGDELLDEVEHDEHLLPM